MNKTTCIASVALASLFFCDSGFAQAEPAPATFPSVRREASKRLFTSEVVEAKILEVQRTLKDPEMAWLFGNCFPSTLDTTVKVGELNGKPDTYIITGDINAMWLRDSSAQVWPYLPYFKQDISLERLIAGTINRLTHYVLIDPYANAHHFDENAPKGWQWGGDLTDMKPGVHERKWEIDSLCYVIRLSYAYWKAGGDPACFDEQWLSAMKLVVKTFKEQQLKTDRGPYRFARGPKEFTRRQEGYGPYTRPTGLIASRFRPSDDSTSHQFLIPSNLFAVVSLREVASMSEQIFKDAAFAKECTDLAEEVDAAVKKHAVVQHPVFGPILAYEVNGAGSVLLMDDANVPNLISLPYLDPSYRDKPLYLNTRRFVLSDYNPFYVKGTAGEGISSPHIARDYIWPMGVIMQAMTSTDDQEITRCLQILKTTHAGTGFMHESFFKDDPKDFTRAWFTWPNGLYGELILKLLAERPHLVR